MAEAEPPPLPPLLEEIRLILEEAGDARAYDRVLKLAEECGGGRLSIPEHPRPRDRIVEVLGGRGAAAVAKHLVLRYPDPAITIPIARPTRLYHKARRLRARGWSVTRICRALILGRNTTLRYIAGMPRPDFSQGPREQPKASLRDLQLDFLDQL